MLFAEMGNIKWEQVIGGSTLIELGLKGTSNNLLFESIKYDFYDFFDMFCDIHCAEFFVKSQFHSVGYATSVYTNVIYKTGQ